MSKWILAAGAAALAMSLPATADPGQGKGGAKKSHQSQGGQKGDRARSAKADRGDRGGGNREFRVARQDRAPDRDGVRAKGRDRDDDRRDARRVVIRDRDDDRRVVIRDDDDDRFERRGRGLGLVDGCPPGLAKRDNGCLPPGHAKRVVGASLPSVFARSMLSGPYRDWYRDDDRYLYRMSDDYIYRVDRNTNLVSALIPFVDRDYRYYPVGAMYPSDFNYYNVPYQYQSYYPDGGDYYYRYGDGAIYSVDPSTQAIQSIVALLAGDLGVGQRLPLGYSAYNVPLSYRDRYYDTPDNMYRYNDGYIYRVDPKTQLITAVINALV